MTQTPDPADARNVQVDIVSDVMCPWCIVGYRQLEQALGMVGAGAYVRWHPFLAHYQALWKLNPSGCLTRCICIPSAQSHVSTLFPSEKENKNTQW